MKPWYNYMFHGEISPPYFDGIQRAHRDIHTKCDRCGERVLAAKVIDPIFSGRENDYYGFRK